MSGQRLSASFNVSTASSFTDNNENTETVNVRSYVKDLLRSRIFLGRYLERRLIDQRIGYRDVVLLSPAEVDLKKDLLDAQHKLRSIYPNTHWIGISDSESIGNSSGACIWTEIDNQPFGPFWFQVKSVKFRDLEIILILKCLRHISDAFLEIEPILTGSVERYKGNSESVKTKIDAKLNEVCYNDITVNFKKALSISNVKEFITFLFAFVIAIFTGSTALVNFLGNFILALIREMSLLIKNSTPMLLGFLDFISKIVGGFYILLAMFFKPNNPNPLNKRSLQYYDRHQKKYNNKDFD